MSKTYMKKEQGDSEIIVVALSDWARYRQSGYVFVETDEDGRTPLQQFVAQSTPPDVAREDVDEGVSMDNTKDEIVAYLETHGIKYSDSDTKAELLDLIE